MLIAFMLVTYDNDVDYVNYVVNINAYYVNNDNLINQLKLKVR